MRNPFAPVSRSLALEPRILFDAAAAAAIDHQQTDQPDAAQSAGNQPAVEAAPRQILAVDSRISGAQSLAASAKPNTIVVLVDAAQDGMAAISAALQQAGKVDSVQILGHGSEGQMRLGSSSLSATSADTARASEWASNLTGSADILIYGCRTGAGESGAALIERLAALTGADVAASTDDTGSATAGGDWVLERQTGQIDSSLAISYDALASYSGLMANASPTVTLSTGSLDTVIGDTLTFTATFTNSTTQPGFAPFIDLIMPATGKDGAGAQIDDGITFVSATYLGQTVTAYTITFDASGNASHPLARDSSGQPVIVNAAAYGAQAGDQLVVLQLPYASVISGQPGIPIVITAQLSNLADTTGSPDLTIKARGGFQFGNDSANNPVTDPSLIEATAQSLVVHPTGLKLTQTINMPEGETVTGPNFERSLTVTATPPPGQTLTNVDISQSLPNTIRVNSITPGAGGTIASLTLRNGSTIADPTLISLALAQSPFLSSYTVRYASMTAPTDTVVRFYVPDIGADGNNIINPVTGDDVSITLGQPAATGEWVPLDPRDQTVVDLGPPPVFGPSVITATGNDAIFIAKSVALLKTVTIASNTGSAGLSPGDELQYTLNLDLSDYFAIGKTLFNAGNLAITDQLGDGQQLTGSPVLTIFFEGVQYEIALVTTVGAPGADGTTLTFDIAQSLANTSAIFGGALIGDIAFDGTLEGPTRALITYRSTVDQAYTTVYRQSDINEGDSIGNNATVSGTLLANNISLTGETEADTSLASLTVPTHTVATSIVSVNGSAASANVELKPGDIVTFKLAYDLETGDYEQFKLSAFMPLPLFDLTGITWTQGTNPGQWTYGSGDTNADDVNSVTVGTGNSLVFDFGDYATSNLVGQRIEVLFTLMVGNQPFADQRPLSVLGQSNQLTTANQSQLISSGVVTIAAVAEPVLTIKHGVVAVAAGTGGIVSGTTGTWAAAGTAGKPFTGSVTDLAAVDGNVSNIDGGDLVRLATAIENTGGLGAFDVATTVTLPPGFAFSGLGLASANLTIYRGDGTELTSGTDYSVAGNVITFLDHNGQPSLLPGRAGTAADTSGANVIIITYDVIASISIAASSNLQTSAVLNKFSSTDNGPDFTGGDDPQDTAEQIVAAPVITKVFANGTLSNDDSSASHTTGNQLVIGESMLYDIVVKLPEGTTQNLRINDLIPAGLRLDTSFGTGGYQIITSTAGSTALTANFVGSVSVGSASAPGGDGADLGLTLSAASATADNNAGNNSFVVRVRLIASNVTGNQAGATRPNNAQLVFSDPDGNTPNGSSAIDRTVALGNSQPNVTVREPTLTVTQSQTNNGGPLGVDRNDVITYTITIGNGSTASDFDAFDIAFSDIAPSQLSFQGSGFSVTYAGGATNNGGPDFVLNTFTNSLQTAANANIDIPKGGSITIIMNGRVRSDLGSILDIVNTAEVQWTSLNGTTSAATAGERSGIDGLINSGVLNDYRNSSSLTVPVAAGATISHVGLLADTPAPTPDTARPQIVAVGELIYYRVAFLIPEGNTANANVVINLPTGLSFAGDTRVGLVDGGTQLVTSDVPGGLTVIPGAGRIDQNITDFEQTLLAADLSNALTAQMRPELIDASNQNAIKITLGTVQNNNNDAFFQMLYLDFFVRVDNLASVDTADNLAVSADFFSDALKQTSTPLALESIVEPNLRDLQKTITDFNPRPSQASGIATVSLNFTNSGDGIAYDAQLTDSVTGGTNYNLSAVIIDGTSYAPGSLPAGVTVLTSGGISADFSTVAIGANVKLIYTVEVPNNAAIASTNATLNWSSLPETFTNGSAVSGGAVVTVGADGTATGERDGSGITTAPNTYVVSEGAGLGIISGTLWDDTLTPTASTTPDGTRIANQTVILTWAGADGDLATTADNRSFTTIADANGDYHFGVLPSGTFHIVVPNPVLNYAFGGDTDNAAVRIDSNAADALGTVTIAGLGEGATTAANFGYVRDNDAPVNTMPANQTMLEDATLNIQGIFIADIDASAGDLTVTLTVRHGTLFLTTGGATGVSIVGGAMDTATVTISGAFDKLNTALQTLLYSPTANFNGTDKLTVTTNDQGNTGDANGNLIPNELADALQDKDTLLITITPVNDAPVAVNDSVIAQEAGGWFNDIDGFPGIINVLRNDIDVDLADNPLVDKLSVSKIGLGDVPPTTTVAVIGNTNVSGDYGTLKINAKGETTYTINNVNPDVQALRLSGNTLSEIFTYELRDIDGSVRSTATITVIIRGANDTPVGVDDEGAVYEAGGVNNGTPGSAPSLPNVLNNDTDVDLNGETKNVTGIRYRRESATSGVFTGVDATRSGVVTGSYGTLTMNYDGSYTYVVDQTATAVQRMVPGDTLIEYFSYLVTDALGDTDTAQIKITINGANDNPVASNDQAAAQAASTNGNAQEVNPTGNVILFQSRPGSLGQVGGNGIDTDVDRTDQPNSNLRVNGIRTGAEGLGDTTTSVSGATTIAGSYGSLTINPDGSFTYDVDSSNATLLALTVGQTVTETFTYKITDTSNPTGLTDLAELNISVRGVNDPPVANDVYASAIEAGGIANATPGVNPAGDATVNDYDPDGDPIRIVGARTGTEGAGGSDTPISAGGSIVLTGTYGSLTLNANGSYSYVLNNANADVQALRTSSNTLTDTFTYTLSDNTTPTPETDQAQIVITIEGRNDNPIGVNDTAIAIEAGGVANGTAGSNPIGNVLSNDTDVDSVANGEAKTVTAIRTGAEAASGTAGLVGIALTGRYGSLTLNDDGSYQYVVDNSNATVQAMRTSGNTLTDTFTYSVTDASGATDLAQLVVTLRGANDAPVANADTGIAVEAGGLNNGAPGSNASGNVLTNDTDVDAGDSKTVTAVSNVASVAGTLGSALAGTYGSVTLNTDGSYTYVVDNTNATVQGLRSTANTLTDTFTYTMRDTTGALSSTTLTLTIRGTNDNPLANNDTGTAIEAGGLNNGTPGSNATGNVLTNDTDVDNIAYGETKTVTTVRTGAESGTGSAGSIGSALTATYGALTLNADGSYTYVINNSNAAVQALRTSADTLTEVFTYRMRDTAGATDIAQLTITIRGANDTPVGKNDIAFAWPAVIGSAGSGRDPQGNVLPNDTDVDAGDSKFVSGIRSGTEAAGGSLDPVSPGTSGGSGTRIEGSYGWLTIGADGSYIYEVDILKTITLQPLDVVQDAFTYELTDTDGLVDQAQLTVVVFGRNDRPIAIDDTNFVTDANGPAVTSGNVLPNDIDLDPIDTKTVTAIRTGEETGTGTAGLLGQTLQGRYGFLIINADGSYTYRVDLSNPDVIRSQGLGPILQDVFTYTMADRGGLTDQAQLTITLDMMAPYVGIDSGWGGSPYDRVPRGEFVYRLGVAPATFVTQAVREVELLLNFSGSETGGERLRLVLPPEISLISQAAGLGFNDDQAIRPLVLQASGEGINQDAGSRSEVATNRIIDTGYGQLLRPTLRFLDILNRFEKSKVAGREGVVSLSADDLLPNISVFSADLPANIGDSTNSNPSAASFSQQLQQLGNKPGKSLPSARPAN